MTPHVALSLEQLGLGSIVQHRRRSWAHRRAQRPVTPAPSCPGWRDIDVTLISSTTLLYRAIVRLMSREWLTTLVRRDVPVEVAVTGWLPSWPRARQRIGTSSEALRRGPRANRRIGRGLVVVSWLRYLQGLGNFFGSCLGYPFLWYPTESYTCYYHLGC